MLPPHIIEWIRERERAREQMERERNQPVLEVPRHSEPSRPSAPPSRGGVTIVPIWGE